eukprot:COSAG06_NODE_3088_length_5874_cov_3.759391_3_plen_209_part_00
MAALSAKHQLAVQDVPYESALRPRLIAAHQILSKEDAPVPAPAPSQPFICVEAWDRCIQVSGKDTPKGGWPNRTYSESSCGGACSSLAPSEWLANVGQFTRDFTGDDGADADAGPLQLVARKDTWLKKSEMVSGSLRAPEKLKVRAGQRVELEHGGSAAAPPLQQEGNYWLAKCAKVDCGLGEATGRVEVAAGGGSGTLWWDGTWCDT